MRNEANREVCGATANRKCETKPIRRGVGGTARMPGSNVRNEANPIFEQYGKAGTPSVSSIGPE
jgi:hypothetical protein